MTSSAALEARPRGGRSAGRLARRHGWTAGVYVLLLLLLLYWQTIPAHWGSFDVQSLAIDALPLAFAAMAQSVVIISGGIDLSVGSLISLVNVVSAKYMIDMGFRNALLFGALLLLGSAARGCVHGLADRADAGPRHRRDARDAVRLGGARARDPPDPGRRCAGAVPPARHRTLVVAVDPVRARDPAARVMRSSGFRSGGRDPGSRCTRSERNRNAAYLSGVGVARTRIFAYALGGLFCGLAGLSLSATSGIGDPSAGQYYTLNSVAAVGARRRLAASAASAASLAPSQLHSWSRS